MYHIVNSVKWHLAPTGRTTCDYGSPATTQNECQEAVAFVAAVANKTPGRNIHVGDGGTCNDGAWGGVPLGCSVQTGRDWTAHFKPSGVNCNTGTQDYQLVCSGAPLGVRQWHLAPAGHANDGVIIKIFEDFIGCAVSTLLV